MVGVAGLRRPLGGASRGGVCGGFQCAARRCAGCVRPSKLAFQPAAAGAGPFGGCQASGGAMAAAYHHLKGPAAAYSMNGIGLHTSPGVDLLHPGYPGKLD